jgi:lipopolysaccharide/colanic/teichoic acid biosynthesis glycosyltransferase
MKIVITGASGFVGQHIIPFLLDRGADLLLAGRDAKRLQDLFPRCQTTSYDQLAERAVGYDALLHLAVRNNGVDGTLEDFRQANVGFLKDTIDLAKAAGIGLFIHASSIQVNDMDKHDDYRQTKREAEALLAEAEGIRIVNLRLAAVYADEFRGKLAILNAIPPALRPLALRCLSCLRPTVHIGKVAEAVLESFNARENTTVTVTDTQKGNFVFHAMKRAIDLAFCLFVIVALGWAMIIVWAAIRLTSPGPAIFVQERIGLHGRVFRCYKFRTMQTGTQQVATHEVPASQILPLGQFLRRTKIDELPQVWNILRNEMSLVGPRPCLPSQTSLIEERAARGVLDIKGGITGWAQIQNIDMSDPLRLARVDREYLDLRTLPMELKILIATATGKGQGDKVR